MRQRLEAIDLPACQWQLAQGQSYSCFLSHYKVEAGADARYLKDALDKMLGCPAYLDSSTLADLRELRSFPKPLTTPRHERSSTLAFDASLSLGFSMTPSGAGWIERSENYSASFCGSASVTFGHRTKS